MILGTEIHIGPLCERG